MGVPVRQASFAGGEVAPELYGRTDIPRHAQAAALMRNFLVSQHGAAMTRPGTVYKGEVYAYSVPPPVTRLIPFYVNGTSGYVLEFMTNTIRVWYQGALVTYPESGSFTAWDTAATYAFGDLVSDGGLYYVNKYQGTQGTDAAVAAPATATTYWTAVTPGEVYVLDTTLLGGIASADLASLRYAQSGDVLTICCVSDSGSTYAPKDIIFHAAYALQVRSAIFGPNGQFVTKPSAVALSGTTADATHPNIFWGYAVTGVDASGHESDAFTVADAAMALYNEDNFEQVLTITAAVTPSSAPAVYYNVYRGRNGLYGYVGSSTAAAPLTFRDVADEPDYTDQPPTLFAEFGSVAGPRAVCYFEDRKVFAGGTNGEATVWASKTGDYYRFARTTPTADDGALRFSLAARKRQRILSLVPLRALIALTDTEEFSLKGSRDAPLAPASADIRAHGAHGSGVVDALAIGNTILHANDRGATVRDLAFDVNTDSYTGNDLSIWASHLLLDHTIVAWAHQSVPFSIVWAVRDDGVLLGLTYDKEHSVVAWHQHETEGGTGGLFEDVCVVPGTEEDDVYFVVKRTIGGATKRYVEQLARRAVIPDIREYVALDSALQFDGRNTGSNAIDIVLTGGDSSSPIAGGDEVTCSCEVAVFAATDVGDVLVFEVDGNAYRVEVTGYTTNKIITGIASQAFPAALVLAGATTDWGWARDTMSGLDHLEGESVTVLADGDVQGPFTVASGAITLEVPAMLVTAGLAYNCDLKPLAIGGGLRQHQKAVEKVSVEVVASRGLMVGEDKDNLKEASTREVSDSYGRTALQTTTVEMVPGSSWNTEGNVYIRQSLPLPLTVTAIVREVAVGGRAGANG